MYGRSGPSLIPMWTRAAFSRVRAHDPHIAQSVLLFLGQFETRPGMESLLVFRLPASHRKRLRTTNMPERLNREIERRTRLATLFPNEASLLPLITGVLMEISEEREQAHRMSRQITSRRPT